MELSSPKLKKPIFFSKNIYIYIFQEGTSEACKFLITREMEFSSSQDQRILNIEFSSLEFSLSEFSSLSESPEEIYLWSEIDVEVFFFFSNVLTFF